MNPLHKRIYEISYKNKLSHIGSCLAVIDTLDYIYSIKKENDIFCLGNSHAFLALAVVLEKYYGFNAEELYLKHGTHAGRDLDNKIFCSGGSLGWVEPISLGIALSSPDINVYLTTSDGAFYGEGSIWETLRFKAEYNINNLKWYVICNGYGAYCEIDTNKLARWIDSFDNTVEIIKVNTDFCGFEGLDAHYKTLPEDYEKRI